MKNHLVVMFIIQVISLASIKETDAQSVSQIKIPDLEKMLGSSENSLLVINFWATWCPPCIKELPHFQKVSEELKSDKVKFIYVSLDFPSQIESQLIPFLQKNQFTSPVSVMMDIDYDKWISKVDQTWQGNIPATLFLNNARKIRKFHPGEMEENELRTLIKQLL